MYSVDGSLYISRGSSYVDKYYKVAFNVYLSQTSDTKGSKTAQTRYVYDNYGNPTTVYLDGDTGTTADDGMIVRNYVVNTSGSVWILDKVAEEQTYTGQTIDSTKLKKQTLYYYDGNTTWGVAPTKGDLTMVQEYANSSSYVTTSYQYDSYGSQTQVTDPRNNSTTFTYDSTYHTNVVTKTYPIGSPAMTEQYTWNYGLGKMLTDIGVNGSASMVTYTYDALGRPQTVVKPGDDSNNPTVKYDGYSTWGTVGQQYIQVQTRTSGTDYQWEKDFFDGLGRIVETQGRAETVSGTAYTMVTPTSYNNVGSVDKQYVPQMVASSQVNGYYQPLSTWQSTSYVYDALGRVTSQTAPDGTTATNSFANWQDTVTDQLGHKKVDVNDAFGNLAQVQEFDASNNVYATTNYTYDVLGNLTQVQDAASNTTSMTYDWLSRKTQTQDPDMGTWSYGYDNNGNLTSQTDAKSQNITFDYDALNRMLHKYQQPNSVVIAAFSYDDTTGGNYGAGLRTKQTYGPSQSDYDSYVYDARGRVTQETRTIDGVNYTTSYTYDSLDRQVTLTYPDGEVVTQTYNGRGLPYALQTGGFVGNYVGYTDYNNLGEVTGMSLLAGSDTLGLSYWGIDKTGGYYGQPWESTLTDNSWAAVRQDLQYTWDAAGNLTQRNNVLAVNDPRQSFGYDFLDRLTSSTFPAFTFDNSGSALTSSPQKAAFDSNGNILVVDQGNNRVVEYSPNGAYLNSFGSYGSGNGQFNNPMGIAVDSNGYIYVSDGTNCRIQKFNADFSYNSQFGSYGSGNSQFKYPTDVAVDSSGNIYVADAFNYKVKKFDSSFNYLTSVSATAAPLGLDVDGSGDVFATDNSGSLKKYNSSLGLVSTLNTSLNMPYDVSADSSGNLWVANSGGNDLVELNSGGTLVNSWTSAGGGLSNFSGPAGVVVRDGQVFVVDTGNNRVVSFDPAAASGSYSYSQIGNITTANGTSYGYGTQPHAVTSVGANSYSYDANGNMTSRAGQSITWDVENRPLTVTGGASFTYDGDGNRVKKIEAGQTTVYVNKYYEVNTTTGVVTKYYYQGGKLVVFNRNGTYGDYYVVGQDNLGSTTTTLYYGSDPVSTVTYAPFGTVQSSTGTMPTDMLFTGQRLDTTELYYYNARYYDPSIGRFISADPLIPSYSDPQSLNRYSYVINNPLRFVDPTGMLQVTDANGFTYNVDPSMLTVQSWVHDNPGLARLLVSSIQAGSLAVDQLSKSGLTLGTVIGERPISQQVPRGQTLILVENNGTIIFVFNSPAPGQEDGVVFVTVLSSRIPGGVQNVEITTASWIPMGSNAMTLNTHEVHLLVTFDILTPKVLAHEMTHIIQCFTTGLYDAFDFVYLLSYVRNTSFYRDMENEAKNAEQDYYDAVLVSRYPVGPVTPTPKGP